MTADDIIKALSVMELTGEDANRVQQAVTAAWQRRQSSVKRSFRVGQKVLVSLKHGTEEGVIKRILKKNVEVHVASTNVNWRVSPGLVEAA